MYINNIPIYFFLIVGIAGILIGQYMEWVIKKLRKKEKVICKDFFKTYLRSFHVNLGLMAVTALLYMITLYVSGIKLETLEYLLIIPSLIGVFIIDYKEHIIPNRLVLSILEVGIVFTFILGSGFIAGADGLNIFIDKLLGLAVGFVVFFLISLISKALSKKEALGSGDVKLMASLGLVFGFSNVLIIALMSFLIGAIVSIVLLIAKKKHFQDYIAFGPFIVIAAIATIFVPHDILVLIIMKIFTLGMYKVK